MSHAPRVRSPNSVLGQPGFSKSYGFALVTAVLFLGAWIGQFFTQLIATRDQATQQGQDLHWGQFLAQFFAATLANWQAEFLQLLWQAAGLALLLFWGSSQSRESDERIETKLDVLLQAQGLDPDRISRHVNQSM
ncbi:MAG TPA: DUF6766 family protein [Propionibacteriaceae bacterium]|nr:DUF6766 family protein [Propionibacteriaceae bacterium]